MLNIIQNQVHLKDHNIGNSTWHNEFTCIQIPQYKATVSNQNHFRINDQSNPYVQLTRCSVLPLNKESISYQYVSFTEGFRKVNWGKLHLLWSALARWDWSNLLQQHWVEVFVTQSQLIIILSTYSTKWVNEMTDPWRHAS